LENGLTNDEALSLQEHDSQEHIDWPPSERKIVVQPYDLSIQTLVEQWQGGLLLIPEVQREYVWDNPRASRLIESLILNIPVPPLYFAETSEAQFEVIDGHQRVKSIARFIDNQFALSGLRVLEEYKGKRFHKLPLREQRFLRTRYIRVVVIGIESHPNMKFEVFERLNTGGVVLNEQELRNSLYRGSLNDLLKELVRDKHFRECIDTKQPRRRMVDQELVLRFFAVHDALSAYRPPLKRFLNEYMQSNQNPVDDWLNGREQMFRDTMKRLNTFLGSRAFRLIDANGEPLTDAEGRQLPRGVNRALFDAQTIAFTCLEETPSLDLRPALLQAISSVMSTDDFQDTVQLATGDRQRLFLRIRLMAQALRQAGANVTLPSALV
jgi:hypothetical protein